MSFFSTILEKLGIGKAEAADGQTQSQGSAPLTPGAPDAPAAAQTAASSVDVAAKLDALAGAHAEKLNWRTSIVDLLKLLGIDSSLTARKELAAELHYTGSTDDSAAMNIWLHKAVLQKLAANGGNVPADLLD